MSWIQAKTFASLIDPGLHRLDTMVDAAHRTVGGCNTGSELLGGSRDSNTWQIFDGKCQLSHLKIYAR